MDTPEPARRVEKSLSGNTAAETLRDFARQNAARVFLVGGAVRDAILERATDDLDFVVANAARTLLEPFLQERGRVELVGVKFGVFKFTPRGLRGKPVDVALPRREQAKSDSRGGYRDFDLQSDPSVPIEEDLARRDFTVNAMAFDLETKTVIDPFKGLTDLEAKMVRAVGDPATRFAEDLTRLLRAVRFAAQLGFVIEEKTWDALRSLAPRLRLSDDPIVAREMVGEELAKTVAADPMRGFALLEESGLREVVLPNGVSPFPRGTTGGSDSTVIWAIALRHLSPDDAKKALRDAGLTAVDAADPRRPKAEEIAWMLKELADTTAIAHLSEREIEKRFMDDRGERYVKFRVALGDEAYIHEAQERIDRIREITDVKYGEIPPLVTGTDILEHGVVPGPGVRELLEDVRERQLKGELKSKSQAMSYLAKATKE